MSKFKANKQQQEAIDFKDGACVVIASAGSGKTKVLTERIKTLVDEHGVEPSNILAISFTKDSANELSSRLGKGYEDVETKTFHSFCLKYLNQSKKNKDLFSSDWRFEKYMDENSDIDQKEMSQAMSWVSYQKNHGIRSTSKRFVSNGVEISETLLVDFYKLYDTYLQKNNKMDFDDMLLFFIDLVKKDKYFAKMINTKYEYILVDEHQDTNDVQQEILKMIAGNGNIMAVGDYRQSLYSFRGSSVGIILDFLDDWENAKLITLPINYRSTKDIVGLANDFIRPTYEYHESYEDAIANNNKNGAIHINPDKSVCEEIERLINEEGVEPKDITILYRNHFLSAEYEIGLRDRNIPYTIVGKTKGFFDRWYIDLVISYLKFAIDTTDQDSFQRVYNDPNRYLSKDFMRNALEKGGNLLYAPTTKWNEQKGLTRLKQDLVDIRVNDKPNKVIERIIKLTNVKARILGLYEDGEMIIKSLDTLMDLASKFKSVKQFLFMVEMMKRKPKLNKNSVKMMTIHGSKGLEFENVFVVGVNPDILPSYRASDEEERRLLYVAMTRAIENLYVYGNSNYIWEIKAILDEKE